VLSHALPGLVKPFVLSVAGFEPRKDPETLIRAFARLPRELRDRHQLVVVCDLPPHGRAQWEQYVVESGLTTSDVLFPGHLGNELLRELYRNAALFAITSHAEGFGLPILEAARCDCPALSTDATALPEILEEPASTFPPGDVTALTTLLERGLVDDEFRATLRAAGRRAAARHAWTSVAERTLRAYELALNGRHARRGARTSTRPRLAMVGPFPPSKSGVAIYSASVVEALCELADVDCFVEGATPPATPGPSRAVRRFPIAALERTFGAGSYDAVVFALGNSWYHRRTLALARRLPGVAWLHDASLAGLYLTACGMFVPDEPAADPATARRRMREAVVRCAGPDAPELGDDDWWRTEAYPAAGLSMTEEVARTARAILVTTETARDIVVRASHPEAHVSVLPLAVPRLPALVADDDGGPPWIVSLGWVDPIKQPHDLVRVLATLRHTTPARLAFVGEAEPRLRDELTELATDVGCRDAVTLTGFVSDDEYRTWLARASCVVLLRRNTHGEGSAALADAIGTQRPVVTNIATAAELPRGVVEQVAQDAAIDEIASAVRRTLDDRDHAHEMTRAADVYAQSWRIEHVAARVLEIALRAPRPEYPAPLVPVGAGPA
jgi:glycosyltransferase involved in cell wall biosynthesis